MRSSLVLASLAAALAFAAPDASAQQGQTAAAAASIQPSWSHAAVPLPAALSPAAREAGQPVAAVGARSPWTYPRYGMIAGALVGAVAGTVMMATADEWIAPPAHIFTVPAGAVAGLAIGAIANLADRP